VLAEAQQRLQTAREKPTPVSFTSYVNDDLDSTGGAPQQIPNTDLTNCVDACRKASNCVAYTFDKWNRTCFLKSNVTKIRLEPKSDSGIRTDFKTPARASDDTLACRYPKSAFTGQVIRSIEKQSSEACKAECDREKSCVAYTFFNKERTCRIFSNPTDRKGDDVGAESGVKAQRAKGSWLCD
jgi:hypothetical protein